MTDINGILPAKGSSDHPGLKEWRVDERSCLEIWVFLFKRDTGQTMRIGYLMSRLREEGNVKTSFWTLPQTKVRGEGVCEKPSRTRREMRHRGQKGGGQEGEAAGGGHILQGNLK